MKYVELDIKIHATYDKTLNSVKADFLNNYKIPFRSYTKGTFHDCIITEQELLNKLIIDKTIQLTNIRKKDGKIIYLYSDGGSFNNGFKNPDKRAFGSFSYLIVFKDEICFSDSICKENYTNNMSEISGVIEGLKKLKEKSMNISCNTEVIIVSDSQYVISGINEWRYNWKKNNWKNYDGNQVSNYELWQELDSLLNEFNISTLWVRGHSNLDESFYKFNNQCDLNCQKILKETLEMEGVK